MPMPTVRIIATGLLFLGGLALGGAIFRLVTMGNIIQAGAPAVGLPGSDTCAPTLRCLALSRSR